MDNDKDVYRGSSFFRNVPFVPARTFGSSAREESFNVSSNDAQEVSDFYKGIIAMPSDAPKNHDECLRRQQERRRQRLSAIIAGKVPVKPAAAGASTTGITKFKQRRTQLVASVSRTSSQTKPVTVAPESTILKTDDNSTGSSDVAMNEIWCSTCQLKIRMDDATRHQHGTVHLLSQDSAIRPLDSLVLGHNNKGFAMMLKSGWDFEKGLGAQGQGRRHPIATQLRQDRRALGSANEPKKVVTHKIDEIETARQKVASSTGKPTFRAPLTAQDHRRKAQQETKERVAMMKYIKS